MNILGSPKTKRRKYLIESFQYRLLAVYLFYFVMVLFIFAGSLFVPLMLQMGDDSLTFRQQERAATQFLTLHTRLWPAVGLTLVLLVLHSVLISHRIAGPLYRIRCVLRMVGAGCLTVRAAFRKHDYLTKERDAINCMIQGLSDRIAGVQRETMTATALFDDLRRSMNSDMPEETRRQFEDLGILLSGINTRLSEFYVSPSETIEPAEEVPLDAPPVEEAPAPV